MQEGFATSGFRCGGRLITAITTKLNTIGYMAPNPGSSPDADRKYPNAPKGWCWQWVFPQDNRWKNLKNGEEAQHHVHKTIL
ncbi:MAG: hypothetical protein NG784_14075 [Candidatus Jettenia sp.]|nr:hypothetical protein [Candidatus Jettenia sp.]